MLRMLIIKNSYLNFLIVESYWLQQFICFCWKGRIRMPSSFTMPQIAAAGIVWWSPQIHTPVLAASSPMTGPVAVLASGCGRRTGSGGWASATACRRCAWRWMCTIWTTWWPVRCTSPRRGCSGSAARPFSSGTRPKVCTYPSTIHFMDKVIVNIQN